MHLLTVGEQVWGFESLTVNLDQMVRTTGSVPASGRTARFEECIAALRACWAPDPVVFDGEHYGIPPSKIGPKPTRGTIPLAIGVVSRAAAERAARLGDGLTVGFRNWDATREQLSWYRDAGGTLPGCPTCKTIAEILPPTLNTATSSPKGLVLDRARRARAQIEHLGPRHGAIPGSSRREWERRRRRSVAPRASLGRRWPSRRGSPLLR